MTNNEKILEMATDLAARMEDTSASLGSAHEQLARIDSFFENVVSAKLDSLLDMQKQILAKINS